MPSHVSTTSDSTEHNGQVVIEHSAPIPIPGMEETLYAGNENRHGLNMDRHRRITREQRDWTQMQRPSQALGDITQSHAVVRLNHGMWERQMVDVQPTQTEVSNSPARIRLRLSVPGLAVTSSPVGTTIEVHRNNTAQGSGLRALRPPAHQHAQHYGGARDIPRSSNSEHLELEGYGGTRNTHYNREQGGELVYGSIINTPSLLDSESLEFERRHITHIPVFRSALQRSRTQRHRTDPSSGRERRSRHRLHRFVVTAEMAHSFARSRIYNPQRLAPTNFQLLEQIVMQGRQFHAEQEPERAREMDAIRDLVMARAVTDHDAVRRRLEDLDHEDGEEQGRNETRDQSGLDQEQGNEQQRWVTADEIMSTAERDMHIRCLQARFNIGVHAGIRESCILHSGDLRYWKAWVQAGRWFEGIRFDAVLDSFEILDLETEVELLRRSRAGWV